MEIKQNHHYRTIYENEHIFKSDVSTYKRGSIQRYFITVFGSPLKTLLRLVKRESNKIFRALSLDI